MSKAVDRTYKHAITILNTRRRPARPGRSTPTTSTSTPSPTSSTQDGVDLRGTPSIQGMREWLVQIGHDTAALNRLNVVHVAGTKGKGSTCAFIESFLRAFGQRTGFPSKTGLYTSPHLIYPEERIRLNFEPISRPLFTKYFFDVWDAVNGSHHTDGPRPRFLQLMALVSIHAFICEGVDAAIIETHHGGEYDATNIFDHPIATVVTALGIDHINQLGPTIENIAWHKAGIFKSGSAGFTSLHDKNIADVLDERAMERNVNLRHIGINVSLPEDAAQLSPNVQRENCSLALAAANQFLLEKSPSKEKSLSSEDLRQAISGFQWPGRFQIVKDGQRAWYLDGAHNEMSIEQAATWFLERSAAESGTAGPNRVLVFGQLSDQRDSAIVFERLAERLKSANIAAAILSLYDAARDYEETLATNPPNDIPESVRTFENIWRESSSTSKLFVEGSVEAAVDRLHAICPNNRDVHILVTGSQHLVGNILFLLQQPQSNPP